MPTKKKRQSAPSKKSKKTSFKFRRIYLSLFSIIAVILFVLFLVGSAWIGYAIGKDDAKKECDRQVSRYREDMQRLRAKLQKAQAVSSVASLSSISSEKPDGIQKVSPKKDHSKKERDKEPSVLSEIKDYQNAGGQEKPVAVKQHGKPSFKRPKLVIIIDDVAFWSQLRAIKKLPWHITPSLFPPTKTHPSTDKMAKTLTHYMIHLPMEAIAFHHPEAQTMLTTWSPRQIDRRLREVRKHFANTRFINNHTGSKFTANTRAMQHFFVAAKRYGFVFIDSRTTPKSIVQKVCAPYQPYLARDIFLDNKLDRVYILSQLRKAVHYAKKRGYAIAIGHPHRVTLEALSGAAAILRGVDVVYIDQLYRMLFR